ncbi:carbonic anhydrase [Malikia sp.]|uniref:carbonic anhydrase n=1 Tax=Malikia sp. TaxID=2070706 RepID=UPI002628B5E7|nr:carbonic anhydrase family protein [Malikia sp.]MDD2730195.1 carbonic anhydrase family protein [Malikia sp.]
MNTQRPLLKTLAVAAAGLLSLAAHAQGHAPHWGYGGHGGPAQWAELDPAFETCAKGTSQSPINISKTEKTELPTLDFQYGATAPTIVNNGHTVQVNLPAGNTLRIGDRNFELLQFHFHTPSEEQVHGKRTAMVAHFVHKNAEGALGVVGVLLQKGKRNAAFEPVFAHLPRAGEQITVDQMKLELADMLPASKGYYAFAGSLTTPPCSEGVNWMVLKTPVQVSQKQIDSFRQLFRFNARPVQPLRNRVIQESI